MSHLTLNGADHEAAVAAEWLLTNELGGFAMGTALGANTRRYHGLLIAARRPPVDRVLLLHSFIEQLDLDGAVVELSSHEFGTPPVIHPDGWRLLTSFELDPAVRARWHWRCGEVTISRTVTVARDANAVRVIYEVTPAGHACRLRLRPLTPLRDFHGLAAETTPAPRIDADGSMVRVAAGDLALVLELTGDEPTWRTEGDWWRDFHYRRDRDRGQTHRETVFSPGVIELAVPADRPASVTITARLDGHRPPAEDAWSPRGLRQTAGRLEARLHRAAGQFVVRRGGGEARSVIAGYPWFADWGRDAMISLPGLLLATGRTDEARSVLETFAEHQRDGIIPNRFDDRGDPPHYNTADASLWFVNAVHAWATAAGVSPPATLVEACRAVVHGYRRGAPGPIGTDGDGLVAVGNATTQLTWMDAKRDGVVFTPRHGKPVEIAGLWHNALCCLAALTDRPAEREELEELAGRSRIAFQMSFWWPSRRCCHDVLVLADGHWVGDERLRPNQVIAAALRFTPMTDAQRTDVIHAARTRLLTPYGLRTLDPDDPAYVGRFEGDMTHRDAAYHQGTVWPWLIGPYCEAVLRAGEFSTSAVAEVERVIAPLLVELDRGCLDQIAEVYDGDPPHRPGGCPAQAWSVAELLRVVHMLAHPATG